MKWLDKGQLQAYLASDQARDWKHLAASLNDLFVNEEKKILISTILCISTALDQWWTFTYFKRCDTSPGYWIKMIWVILVENFTWFPVVPCLWNFLSIISFSAPSQDLHAAVLRLDKWHKHRINSVSIHHSNCLLWSCHHLKALGENHLMDKQLADVEPSEETG